MSRPTTKCPNCGRDVFAYVTFTCYGKSLVHNHVDRDGIPCRVTHECVNCIRPIEEPRSAARIEAVRP